LPLPVAYLHDRALRDLLRDALFLAEHVSHLFTSEQFTTPVQANATQGARQARPMRVLAEALLGGDARRPPERREMEYLIEGFGAARAYWSDLEAPFRHCMARLPEASRDEEARMTLRDWANDIERHAREAFDAVARHLDQSAHALRAASLAERAFAWQLQEILAPFRSQIRSQHGTAG
jgi:hypothetical protein